jgi:hypothetical protein
MVEDRAGMVILEPSAESSVVVDVEDAVVRKEKGS